MTDPVKLAQKIAEHVTSKTKPAPMHDASIVKLPVWPEARRAIPSVAVRAALFPALGRVKRRRLWDEAIFTVGDAVVTFRGEQLDQTDLDVYLEIMHLMRDQGEVSFSAHSLLKALGRQTGKANHEWLRRVVDRLVAGYVKIKLPDAPVYFGHLIDGGKRDEITEKYILTVNSELARLIKDAWSSLDISQRRALKSPTAKALHAYLSSHRNPGPHKLDTLTGIAGLTGEKAKTTILKALDELQGAGFLPSYSINGDLVALVQAPKLSTDG